MIQNRSLLLLIIALLLMSGCSKPLAPASEPGSVLSNAHVYSYIDLPSDYKKAISPYCCSYSRGSWDAASLVAFNPEDSYFVELMVNRESLINLTYVNSCGSLTNPRHCSVAELERKLRSESFQGRSLYGKYRSSWSFSAENVAIPDTLKFDGHNMLYYENRGQNDLVVIGPLPTLPKKAELEIWNGSPRGNPALIL